MELLDMARRMNYFVWMRLGDHETGRDWMDDCDVTGFVSRSMGPIKIPILLATRRSSGGGSILDSCIVKLVVHGGGYNRAWQSANYQAPDLVIEHDPNGKGPAAVLVRKRHDDQTIEARFPNRVKAQRWVDFITGRRLTK